MNVIRTSIIAGTLFASLGTVASSASLPVDESNKRTLTLSRGQRRKIYFDVTKLDGSEVAPPTFVAKIGETVPSGVKISPLPASTVKLASMLNLTSTPFYTIMR
jgi:hypothetical protein